MVSQHPARDSGRRREGFGRERAGIGMVGRQSIELKPSPLDPSTWAGVVTMLALPPRQAAVVELVIRGASDKQIAEELGLAVSTVRDYLGRIFRRLDVQDRIGLAVRVMATAMVVKQPT